MKINFNNQLFFIVSLVSGFTICHSQVQENKEPGIIISNMDKNSLPADNFFRFVNGAWLDKTEIPSDKTSWGSFNELRKKTDIDALSILKEAALNPMYKSNTDEGKAINLYKTLMDTIGRDKKGLSPLKPYLAKINAIKNVKDLQAL
jgi:predicted metalloendopeptidase